MDETRHDDREPLVKVVDRRWWVQQGQAADAVGTKADEEAGRPGKPTYVEELERQLAEKDRQLAEILAKYREASREFDDARARLRKDIAKEVERGRRTLLVELLDVVDNLDRAVEAARSAGGAEGLLQGVDLVRRQFLAKLEGFGVTRVDPLGEPFDHARHEAVTAVPTAEASQDGLVVGVLAPGYLVGDEVLRPAQVAVTRLAGE
jgi:molecular chaperone GrpE